MTKEDNQIQIRTNKDNFEHNFLTNVLLANTRFSRTHKLIGVGT